MNELDDNATCLACIEAGLLGSIWVTFSSKGVVGITFEKPPGEFAARSLPADWYRVLTSYFSGTAIDLDVVPVDLRGTDFQLRVWNALRKIPHGRVRTYASIATDVGSPRAMRAVGAASGANPIPILVPCHRVIEANMRVGGYSGGVERKRALLELEGHILEGDLVRPGQLDLFRASDR